MSTIFVEDYPDEARRTEIRAEQLLPTYFDTTPEAQKTRVDAVGLFDDPAFVRAKKYDT